MIKSRLEPQTVKQLNLEPWSLQVRLCLLDESHWRKRKLCSLKLSSTPTWSFVNSRLFVCVFDRSAALKVTGQMIAMLMMDCCINVKSRKIVVLDPLSDRIKLLKISMKMTNFLHEWVLMTADICQDVWPRSNSFGNFVSQPCQQVRKASKWKLWVCWLLMRPRQLFYNANQNSKLGAFHFSANFGKDHRQGRLLCHRLTIGCH